MVADRTDARMTENSTASPAKRRYRCRDGVIAIACRSEAQWRALAKCLGRPELAYAGDWEAARTAPPRGRLGRLLEEIFREDTADVWLNRLGSHGVPTVPVRRGSARIASNTA